MRYTNAYLARNILTGSLRYHDGDGNKNGKKAISLDWQNNNLARASCFFVVSLPSLHVYDVKLRNFTLYGGRKHKTTIFFFFCEVRFAPLKFIYS